MVWFVDIFVYSSMNYVVVKMFIYWYYLGFIVINDVFIYSRWDIFG